MPSWRKGFFSKLQRLMHLLIAAHLAAPVHERFRRFHSQCGAFSAASSSAAPRSIAAKRTMHADHISRSRRVDSSARSALPPETHSGMNTPTDRRETADVCRMHPTSRSRREDSSARSALPPETHSGMNIPGRSPRNGRCMPNASHNQREDSAEMSAISLETHCGAQDLAMTD